MPDFELTKINEAARTPERTIADAEAHYEEQIEDVARKIVSEEVRVILLAGPSASGKTTTANLIADSVREKGYGALVVSLDDFYRSGKDPDYPLNEAGEKDFECPEALAIDEIRETVAAIADDKPFRLPKFDFRIGDRASVTEHEPIGRGVVIVEGLHAINPKIASAIEGKNAFKMFISVSTSITENGEQILSGKKLRFTRRLVRDNIFRASDAKRTFSLWQSVLEGEIKYLYPYRNTADVYFDTFHLFEPGVMRDMALPLLYGSPVEHEDYIQTVIGALSRVEPIDLSLVPDTSLLREFTSGGIYEKLY